MFLICVCDIYLYTSNLKRIYNQHSGCLIIIISVSFSPSLSLSLTVFFVRLYIHTHRKIKVRIRRYTEAYSVIEELYLSNIYPAGRSESSSDNVSKCSSELHRYSANKRIVYMYRNEGCVLVYTYTSYMADYYGLVSQKLESRLSL